MFSNIEERYSTINIHGLLHLPEVVNNLGPHSCFPFESANGDLLKFFHGSCGVEKQVNIIYAVYCNPNDVYVFIDCTSCECYSGIGYLNQFLY